MKTETRNIHHTVVLPASAREVYEVFMNEKLHALATRMAAKIDPREGGRFLTCGDRNFGYNLALEPGKRIVQAWSHKAFPKGHYSVIELILHEKRGKTTIEFHHYAAPKNCYSWLNPGWYFAYWDRLREFFEKQKEKKKIAAKTRRR